jgi:protoporphyrinogen oxidase
VPSPPIVVIGGGLAGLFVAARFREHRLATIVLEGSGRVGGAAGSWARDGFVFDHGIHALYGSGARWVQSSPFASRLQSARLSVGASAFGRWMAYPPLFGLHAAPDEVRRACVADFERTAAHGHGTAQNYAAYCRDHLGDAYCDYFLLPYLRKFWATDPACLDVGWAAHRLTIPTVEQVRSGSQSNAPAPTHYATQATYPEHGGFGGLADAVAQGLDVHLNAKVTAIDPEARRVRVNGAQDVTYASLISTIPLPQLAILLGARGQTLAAANSLSATSLLTVNVALESPPALPGAWVHIFDAECPASRASAPGAFCTNNVPRGYGSFQAEVYYRGEPPRAVQDHVLEWATRRKVFDARDVVWVETQTLRHANVVHDLRRSDAVASLKTFVHKRGVHVAGRYGLWDYALVGDVIAHGVGLVDWIAATMRAD